MLYSNPSTSRSAAEAELDPDAPPPFRQLVICDPDAPPPDIDPGSLLLGIGLHPAAAHRFLAGLAGLADPGGAGGHAGHAGHGGHIVGLVLSRPGPADERALLSSPTGVPVLFRPDSMSWDELYRRLGESQAPGPIAADDELADLAQTIATLTGGLVSIEDTSARVLAYSRSSDDVDDLRRLSILGRSGPQEYLELLREWGVYDRLAASEDVIEIAEHPASGVRRRLAVGVFAGSRQLGTIWVQQGRTEFPPHAKQALLGAARITADQLTAHRGRNRAGSRSDAADVAALLTGRSTSVPTITGRLARQPCAVAVFELGPVDPDAGTDAQPADPSRRTDRAAERLAAEELAAIVTVHLAAFRRDALTAVIDGRTYAVLPGLTAARPALSAASAAGGRTDPVVAVLNRAVAAARKHLRPTVRCSLGPRVPSLAEAGRSRAAADRALALVGTNIAVTSFDEVRARLAVNEAVGSLARRDDLRNLPLAQLCEDDPETARTVLLTLDHGGHLAAVATELGIHVTTVRYRLRKAAELADLDLDDPDERLAAHLQMRATFGSVLHPG